jgi:galactose-1-phosphate uridylyltransferase
MDYVLNQENVLSIREVIRKILYALGMAPSCSFDFSYVHTHTHTHTKNVSSSCHILLHFPFFAKKQDDKKNDIPSN